MRSTRSGSSALGIVAGAAIVSSSIMSCLLGSTAAEAQAAATAAAAAAFDRAGGAPEASTCPLAPYARLRSAQALLKNGTTGAGERARLASAGLKLYRSRAV